MKRRKEFEKIEDSCADVSLDFVGDSPWTDKIKGKEYDDSSKHPTPEQLLVREAVKFLTPKQRTAWECYNYDKLTMDEIAEKLRISQQAVQYRISGAEKRIVKWVKSNTGAYKLIRREIDRE